MNRLSLVVLLALSALSCDRGRDGNEIVGAYKLAALDEVGTDGTPRRADATGSLVLTHGRRTSVQVMYRDSASQPGGPVQYAQGGYEASFGRCEVDDHSHAFTYHVEGALVRSLIGKDMKRLYERMGTQLVVKPPTAESTGASLGNVTENIMMNSWTNDELKMIAEADDLHVAPFRDDRSTYGPLTWVWSVVVDGALYVRAYNGKQSRWYGAARLQKAGRITAAGMTKEVAFGPVDGPIQERIDEAYRAKYRTSAYLAPMLGPRARAATLKIVLRTAAGEEKRS